MQFAYRLSWAWYWHQNSPQSKPIEENPKLQAIKSIEEKLVLKSDTISIHFCNNPCLEFYIQQVSKSLLQTNSRRHSLLQDNLPHESRKALQEMKKWREIVIRPADKGSKIFVLDREDYVQRVLVHLNDATTLVVIEDHAAAIDAARGAVLNWCETFSYEEGMSANIISAIQPDENCKPGNNYLLLKAHKPERNFPGRLISTGCNSYTNTLSALTAIELSKVELPYVIKDINHFLKKIHEINLSELLTNKEVIHVSFDAVSMFPSISKDVGLEQCEMHLNKRTDPLFSTACILEALDITLSHNLTTFEEKMYKQVKRTAMGPKNACIYADVAMNSIDVMVNEGEWNLKQKPAALGTF